VIIGNAPALVICRCLQRPSEPLILDEEFAYVVLQVLQIGLVLVFSVRNASLPHRNSLID